MYCIHCGHKLEDDTKFCINCGEATGAVEPSPDTCRCCGAALTGEKRFCPECGASAAGVGNPMPAEPNSQLAPKEQLAPSDRYPFLAAMIEFDLGYGTALNRLMFTLLFTSGSILVVLLMALIYIKLIIL